MKYEKPKEQLALRKLINNLAKSRNIKVVLLGSDNMENRSGGLIKNSYYGFYMPSFEQLAEREKVFSIQFVYGHVIFFDLRLLEAQTLEVRATTFLMFNDTACVNFAANYLMGEIKKQYEDKNNVTNKLCNYINTVEIKEIKNSHYGFDIKKIVLVALYYQILCLIKEGKEPITAIENCELSDFKIKKIQTMNLEEVKNELNFYQKRIKKIKFDKLSTSSKLKEKIGKYIVSNLSGRRIL